MTKYNIKVYNNFTGSLIYEKTLEWSSGLVSVTSQAILFKRQNGDILYSFPVSNTIMTSSE